MRPFYRSPVTLGNLGSTLCPGLSLLAHSDAFTLHPNRILVPFLRHSPACLAAFLDLPRTPETHPESDLWSFLLPGYSSQSVVQPCPHSHSQKPELFRDRSLFQPLRQSQYHVNPSPLGWLQFSSGPGA